MKLAELQRSFVLHVQAGTEQAGLPATGAGMRIYRNNYRGQLKAALRTSYPHLAAWLGETAFDRAADEQIMKSPPHSWTLDDYGRDFPALLRRLFPDDPEIAELAWIELALAEAFVARDADPVAPRALNGIDWDGALFGFVPSFRLASGTTNAATIWTALEAGSAPPPAEHVPGGHGYVVWRPALAPRLRVAIPAEHGALEALYGGATFGETCEALRAIVGPDQAVQAVSEMLARWLGEGLVEEVRQRRGGEGQV